MLAVCKTCIVRYMLDLVLRVGITSADEDQQYLFRLFARVFATSIMDYIEENRSGMKHLSELYSSHIWYISTCPILLLYLNCSWMCVLHCQPVSRVLRTSAYWDDYPHFSKGT